MKKRTLTIFVLLVTLVFMGISCKTTPNVKPSEDAAEAARRRAMDFDADKSFQSEWAAIEREYFSVVNMDKSSNENKEEAIVLFDAVTEKYDGIYERAVPVYAQAKENEIKAARDEVFATGFAASMSDWIDDADKMVQLSRDQYDIGENYKAKDTAESALNEYKNLLVMAQLSAARKEIDNRGFAQFDQDNFNRANDAANTAFSRYGSNKQSAMESAQEALLRYNLVMNSGWAATVDDCRDAAIAGREAALEEKADIAVRNVFQEADALYNQAERDYRAQRYDTAALAFVEAEDLFASARRQTEEKRQLASETIRHAEEKIEESDETAAEAERIIEGGSI